MSVSERKKHPAPSPHCLWTGLHSSLLHCFLLFSAHAPNYWPPGPCWYLPPAWDTLYEVHMSISVWLLAQSKCCLIDKILLGWSLLKFPYQSKCIFNMILIYVCLALWLFIPISHLFYAGSSLWAGSTFIHSVAWPKAWPMEGTGSKFVN